MTREEQIFNGFAEMMKGLLGNENLEVPNFETPQDSCEDAIIRHVVKEQMIKYGFNAPDMTVTEFVESLPPVTPQQKTGQWWERNTYPQERRSWDCSECQEIVFEKTNYCPNCGAKMQEVEE